VTDLIRKAQHLINICGLQKNENHSQISISTVGLEAKKLD